MTPNASKNQTLHGNVPDECSIALLLVDVINDLDFPGNFELLKEAPRLGRNIAALKKRCTDSGIPVIYANDNRDKWRSEFSTVVSHCLAPDSPGRILVEKIIPVPDDYRI